MTIPEEKFTETLKTGTLADLLSLLQTCKSPHRNTPPKKIKQAAVKRIKSYFADDAQQIFDFASALTASNDPTADQIAAHLFVFAYPYHPSEVTGHLHQLADRDDWEVREWAAGACGRILSRHFDRFYPVMFAWTSDESYKARRAAAVAAKYAARELEATYSESLLDLVEELLTDEHRYVKKNLGPFAIGDGLLKYYPDQTLARVDRWAEMENEHARWNVAKIFSTAEGAGYPDEAARILKKLKHDERYVVRRAVQSTINKLKKVHPERKF
ncbi:MAG: DNA alkylation repair protein [Bacillaceae bacterium]|nr:DNA alkylation repair protein [Bacillaceae bacterium]